MEPINTHDFPLSHEPVEEWQNVSAASAGEADTVESLESEGSAASTKESVTTGFAELGTIGGAQSGGSRENVMGAEPRR